MFRMLSSRTMKRAFGAAVVVSLLIWSSPGAAANDGALRDALVAWDRGDYIAALTLYLKALASASEPESTSIALATGELYTTIELTTDGSAPRFSPDGRSLTYESGTGTKRRIRIASIEQPTTITTELVGFQCRLLPRRLADGVSENHADTRARTGTGGTGAITCGRARPTAGGSQ